MTKAPDCIVHAVCTLTVEIPVRSSHGSETLDQLHEQAEKEALRILGGDLPPSWRAIGKPTFSYATVRSSK